MERSANFIAFVHPTRAPRKLRFVRQGRRGLHATGGIWGEPDWFESVYPDAADLLPLLASRVRDYLQQGFTISSERVWDKAFAQALGRPVAPRPTSLAAEKQREKTQGRAKGVAALAGPMPKTVEGLAKAVKDLKAAYLRPLGRDLRTQVSARLDECDARLIRIAKGKSADAARARRVLPPGMRRG